MFNLKSMPDINIFFISLLLVAAGGVFFSFLNFNSVLSFTLHELLMFTAAFLGSFAALKAAKSASISSEIASKQQSHIFSESHKSDLYNCILQCEKDIEKTLDNCPNFRGENNYEITLQEVLFDPISSYYKQCLEDHSVLTQKSESSLDDEIPVSYEERLKLNPLIILTNNINLIAQYLKTYNQQSNNKALVIYYKAKYKYFIKRLHEKNYPINGFWFENN